MGAKVLQINAVYGIGSTGRTVKELHLWLLSHGHESFVAAPNIEESDPHLICVGGKATQKRGAMLSRLTGFDGLGAKRATRNLIARIKEIGPDVIVLRNLHAHFLNYEEFFTFLAEYGKPVVLFLHDCYFFTGKCMHFADVGCEKWKTGCGQCPKLKADIPSWFFDRTAEMFERKRKYFQNLKKKYVAGVSEWTAGLARESFLKEADGITVLYNWVDTDLFNDADRDKKGEKIRKELGLEDKFLILCVASGWSRGKGADSVAELSRKLKPDQRIIMVGNTDNIVVPNSIVKIGAINDPKKLRDVYAAADVLYQPSKFETFGKVVVEAEACGTPVVTNGFSANPEVVGSGCGYVVQDGDVAKTYECIETIAKHGKAKYSAACRNFAVGRFSKDRCIKAFEDFIRSIV
jgi:glycosyltransferase involved in cell wall biosynthesis